MSQEREPLAQAEALSLLSEGEIAVQGLIPWSSNATLLVTVGLDALSALAVYKPQRGETPLWDFPPGTLGKREVAAYLLSEALGWSLVPPTVQREGPYGLGSLQLFVHAREDAHYFTLRQAGTHQAALIRLAALDAVANNADRKSGHCLLDRSDRLWAIDNALTFHVDPKLRTVIWDYAGMPFPGHIREGLVSLQDKLRKEADLSRALQPLLSSEEIEALRSRLQELVASGTYPPPGPGRVVPWPLV